MENPTESTLPSSHNSVTENPVAQVDKFAAPIKLFESQTKRLKAYFREATADLMGTRIIFGGNAATVRYAGPLMHEGRPEGSDSELWVGVVWDDKTRGKHDGTVNNYQYFVCHPGAGSLLRFEKIEFGYKVETGLFKRYFRPQELYAAKSIYDQLETIKVSSKTEAEKQKERDELGKRKHLHIEYDSEAYVETLRKNKVMVEFVGFDEIWNKIHNLDRIENISLSNSSICDLGHQGMLRKLFPNLTTLSLEDNHIFDWHQIYLIGHELEHLKELALTGNPLRQPQHAAELDHIKIMYSHSQRIPVSPVGIFKKLKSLVLINTHTTWKSLFKVLPAFPNVQELILCRNDMSDTENIVLADENALSNLKFLNLEDTNLESFEGIKKFKNLKSLNKLILNKNFLERFGKIEGFLQLKSLSVESNRIRNPYAISELAAIQTVEYFNIRHNPVGDKYGNGYVRQRAVSEFPKLIVINGADLKKYERKDCEVYYLRETFGQYFQLRKVPDYDYDYNDFLEWARKNHPRMEYLIKKYGNPFEPQKKEIVQIIKKEVEETELTKKPGGMQEIKIEFKAGLLKGQTQTKRVPLSWTVANLKNLFSKTLKIPLKSIKLTCTARKDSAQQPMDQQHKVLYFYNLNYSSVVYLDIVN